MKAFGFGGLLFIAALSVSSASPLQDPELIYPPYSPDGTEIVISRSAYLDQLHGFWLAECIANWTGLITEGDKVEAPFYTDENWGGPDEPNIWGGSGISPVIDFYFVYDGDVWKSDDDTNIEYMYQHLLDVNNVSVLTPVQIRDGWLKHIWSDNFGENGENYLWVSNERAFELMREGMLPPDTSLPRNNPDYEMIDAQLTTEIFGLFAPARPDVALALAKMPIQTTARQNAQWISEFYVVMHSLASRVNRDLPMRDQVFWLAGQARAQLPNDSFAADMYDFVRDHYAANPDKDDWEATRDAFYQAYQVEGRGGYEYKQMFDAGINFGSSLVSLFYGAGDLPRTIQIGALAGWDSDNPTATWAGLLGFILGKDGVGKAFGIDNFSESYIISNTRREFPDRTPDQDGEDTFTLMAKRGILIIDRVVLEKIEGGVDLEKDVWYLPEAEDWRQLDHP